MLRRTNHLLFLVIFALSSIAGAGLWKLFSQQDTPTSQVARTSGTAAIGGPFSLTDHRGERKNESSLLGHYTLVYFGYTYCPDICPTELQVIGAALDLQAARAPDRMSQIQAYFITIDPARDDQATLADYVPNFHAKLVGLTGSQEEIAAAAKAYRVYYAKVEDEDSPVAEFADDYFMDHSNIVYLMGPDGHYLTHFRYGASPEDIADTLHDLLG